jgi:hypothetical protein
MKQWMAIVYILVTPTFALIAVAEPVAPKRIDGGILTPTTDSIKQLISECVPIKIVVSFIILEDGTTADLKVIEAEPVGVDVSILLEAVAQFQYEPIIVNGIPVQSNIQTQATIYDPANDPNCNQTDK